MTISLVSLNKSAIFLSSVLTSQRDLMKAITIYRDYLRKWNCLENAREEALQHIIDGVIEEQHEKVTANRKREHDQRRQLHQVPLMTSL